MTTGTHHAEATRGWPRGHAVVLLPQRRKSVERILETYRFGPHQVVVLEHVEDDGITYTIVVDDLTITDLPLQTAPQFEDVVRIYAQSQESGASEDLAEG